MKTAIVLFSLLSLASGLLLLWSSFGDNWWQFLLFLAVGLGAILAAIKYTVGANPYGYAGLGDLFVLIFFGIVGVGGTYYLHAGAWEWSILLPAISCGFLAVGVLNVNNIRDIESDEVAGKRSIPVRIGERSAKIYHLLLLTGAVLASITFLMMTGGPPLSYLFLVATPMLFVHYRAVHKKSGRDLDPHLKQLAITTLILVLLFGLGLLHDRFF